MSAQRAYSLLTIKALADDKREIVGIATSPETDRMGDIVLPAGAKYKLPMPFLWQHDHQQPIGEIYEVKEVREGLQIKARLVKPLEDMPSQLKARLDEAWASIKTGLVRGLSIGFRAIEYDLIPDTGGLLFKRWDLYEISAVTIPANAAGSITSVKSFDQEARKIASDQKSASLSSASPSSVADTTIKTVKIIHKEKSVMSLQQFRDTLAQKNAKLVELAKKSQDSGETFDAAEQEEFDTISQEVAELEGHIKRLEVAEKAALGSAKPVTAAAGTTEKSAVAARGGFATVKAAKPTEPGIAMAQVVRCLGLANGNKSEALEIAKSIYPDNDDVIKALDFRKAAVAAGSTTDATWAGPLVPDQGGALGDFVEYLRPQTIIGKFGANNIPALRNVPFYTRLVSQTTGGAAGWVGEGKAKPVTKFDFADTTLLPLKVAAISVVTEELLRNSSPSADRLIRDGLVEAARERLDIDFVDPAKAASAGVSPASITNGVTPINASGTGTADDVRCDLLALWQGYIAANVNPTGAVLIMSSSTALALSLMVNALGQPEFPGITMQGGFLNGVPVIVSEYVGQLANTAGGYVFLVNASDIWLGDDGGFRVDLSREATIQMDTAPTQSSVATVTATSGVSMFQTNSVAFRAERTINWAKRRASAVAVLAGVNWGAC